MDNHSGEQSVAEYLAVLRRRKWIVLLAVVIAPAVAVVLSRSQPKLFTASTDVLLTSSATGVQSPLGSDATSLIATQQEIASSPAVAERVVRAMHLTARTAGQVSSEASFGAVGSADVLRISIADRDPSLTVQLANAYAQQYVQYRRKLDSSFLDSTRKEIEARMAALRDSGQEGSSVYAALASQAQGLLQSEALQTVSAVVLRPATGASQIQPTPTRYGILGLGIGLILGFALALLWDAIDPRVRTTHDIAGMIGLPVLGRLAAPRRRLRKRHRLTMLEDAAGRDANALRILGTNLDLANLKRNAKLLMITSPTEGEGKSTTAANLAVALARAGRDVVLVDLDLHRPVIAKFFDLQDSIGVTGVAAGRATIDQAIVRVPVAVSETDTSTAADGTHGHGAVTVLRVLPAGPTPSNPGEFMATKAVPSILAALRERAEIVVIDAPPLLEVSDTLSLSAVVDAVVLVTRVKMARRAILRQTRQILSSSPAAKLGIVVTGIEHEKGYWYDRYGSYYYNPSSSAEGRAADRPDHVGMGPR